MLCVVALLLPPPPASVAFLCFIFKIARIKEGRAKEKKVTGGTTEQQATPVSRRQPNKKVKTTTGLIPHSLSFTLIT